MSGFKGTSVAAFLTVMASVGPSISAVAQEAAGQAEKPTELPAVEVTTAVPKAKKKQAVKKAPQVVPAPIAVAADPAPGNATEELTDTTKVLGNPPPAYAGGVVASGARVGIFGNQNIFDTPYSVTGFTQQAIQEVQARNVSDVLERDPSVKIQNGPALYYESISIRGFDYGSYDYALNGLFGIMPATTFPLEVFERIEVFKGPSLFLSGASPFGVVGGVVNAVTKHADDQPITQLTTTFWSEGMVGTNLDVGRRYGAAKEWGIRANGVFRDGATEVDNNKQKVAAGSLALDYRGDRLRLAFDIIHQDIDTDGLRGAFNLLPGVVVPRGGACYTCQTQDYPLHCDL